MLLNNRTLEILFMHYNPLTAFGGKFIADGLKHNTTLQVLDLSFCSMGKAPKGQEGAKTTDEGTESASGSKPQTAAPKEEAPKKEEKAKGVNKEQLEEERKKKLEAEKAKQKILDDLHALPYRKRKVLEYMIDYKPSEAWSNALRENVNLIHLDFSHNYFDSRELEVINEGLSDNHTILGLHMAGNEGETDAQGFIKPHDHSGQIDNNVASFSIFTRIQPNLN